MASAKWMKFKPNGTVVPFNEKLYGTGKFDKWEPKQFEYPKFEPATPSVVEQEDISEKQPVKRKYTPRVEAEAQSEA